MFACIGFTSAAFGHVCGGGETTDMLKIPEVRLIHALLFWLRCVRKKLQASLNWLSVSLFSVISVVIAFFWKFDEPTSALDVAVQRQVVQEMLHVRELFGTAIIIVTHDIGVVSTMADTVLVLQNGNKMEYGPVKDVLEHPQNIYTKELLSAVPKLRRSQN